MSPSLPPVDLQSKLQIVSIAVRSEMHRVYTSTFEPIYFDRSDLSRFNAPDGSCGVRCMAWKFEGVFAETFLRTPGNTLSDIGFLERKTCKGVSATDGRPGAPYCRGLAVAGKTVEVPILACTIACRRHGPARLPRSRPGSSSKSWPIYPSFAA